MQAVTQGTLRTREGAELPLLSTQVRGVIRGPVARVELEQEFRNHCAVPIEAVYSFPLPSSASVEHMEFRLEDRVVKGVVKDKAQARADYERARQQGRSATLLEQEESSLFTLSVANVQPDETLRVVLRYQEVLRFDDGWWRFVFPLVAPERYEPVPRGPRRPTGQRAGDVSIELEVYPQDGDLDSLSCPTHPVHIDGNKVTLEGTEDLPNRDLVLTWKAAGAGVRPTVQFERGQPGTLLLVLSPPQSSEPPAAQQGNMKALQCGNCGGPVTDVAAIQQIPGLGPVFPCKFCGAVLTPSQEGRITRASRVRDVLVLVDRSASMRGCMAQVRQAVQALIRTLCPGDALQVVAFDHDQLAFDGDGTRFVTLSPEVAGRIDTFLSTLAPRGGTELERALELAPKPAAREGSSRPVVLVTDGAVGNEGRLLRRIAELFPTGQGRRLFVLGVGPSLDRRLIERMARAGGGASDALAPGEDTHTVLERFGRRVRDGGPVLTGLSLSFEGVKPADLYPSALPDLFGGEPVTVLGRLPSLEGGKLVLTAATADGRPFRQELVLQEPAEDTPGLVRLWARRRIEALMDQISADRSCEPRLGPQITALALEHGLVSAYTSLVAEDSEVRSEGPPVRVELPAAAPADLGGDVLHDEEPTMTRAGGGAPGRPMSMASPSMPAPPPMAEHAARPRMASPAPHAGPMPAPAPSRAKRGPGLIGAVGGAIAAGFSRMFGGEPTPPEPVGPVVNPPPPDPQGSPLSLEASDSERYPAEELSFIQARTSGELDLVFLVDETGSMGSYIEQVKARLTQLIEVLSKSPLCRSLRIGLVTYRDHPPQDSTYPSRVVPLTQDLAKLRAEVQRLAASGGGDGPESVTDGLYELVRLEWRPKAAKTVVWFGDAPPHGVIPFGDGFPQGCPCGHHWFTQAESCREMGVAVHAVGCVPGIQGFVGAEDVFRLVASTARGLYLPLSDAELLVPIIVGAAYTELDKQRLDERLTDLMAENKEVLAQTDEAERIRWLTEQLGQRGVQPRALDYDPARRQPSPMRFRALQPADVAASLDRLRQSERV
jgi:Ca-activated chloride channel family protein